MATSDDPHIHEYKGPAGGWSALAASARHVLREKSTGRSLRSLLRVNQPDGFDCPGCAWPEPKDAHRFEFCENGVKAVAWETTGKRVAPEFFARHSVADLEARSGHWLESQGRLTHPMRYNAATDHYEPVEWDEAFKLIGDALQTLDDPDRAILYTSGRTSNEAAFLYQLFGRMLGTNNFPDCSNMCHESSGVALGQSIGIGKGTVTIDDFQQADAIFVVGQNPGTNHPRMLAELQKAAERGATIVTINPLKERGLERFVHPQRPMQMLTGSATAITSLYLQPMVGGDLAVLKGMIKYALAVEDQRGGVVDHDFIAQHTDGFDAVAADARAAAWPDIEQHSGLSRADIERAGEVYIGADRAIICWAMGLTQNKHAVPTIQTVANLLLLRGNVGKPGAGACPVRGHSNVQGDRTVGIAHNPKPAFLQRLGEVFGFTPPTEPGLDTVGAINAMADGSATVFISMGGNFAEATPDTPVTEAALRRCDLTVQVSTKLNRSHVVHGKGALILPCLGRSELDVQAAGPQRVTVEDSMSMVHASAGRLAPASGRLLSEPAIVAGMATAALPHAKVDWNWLIADYDRIRDKIAAVLPVLFADYNQKISHPGGFHLRNSAREREWNTAVGKARFIVHAIPDLSLPDGQLRLMTLRSHDQYNTTIYSHDDRYRGVSGTRKVIFMHEADIAAAGLSDGDVTDITSHTIEDGKTRIAHGFRVVKYDIPRRCAAAYFPETNVLVSKDSYAHGSRTPMSKFVPVTVAKASS